MQQLSSLETKLGRPLGAMTLLGLIEVAQAHTPAEVSCGGMGISGVLGDEKAPG